MTAGFNGFPVAALDFYDDLEMDNTRSFWEKHKAIYAESVRGPMTALATALAPEFAPDGQTVKVFRPFRDVRFAKDKTPYKNHQGAFVRYGDTTGWYVEVSPRGVGLGAGFYDASSPRLHAIRRAIDHDLTGPELERLLHGLRSDGWEVGGDRLKTTPRGYPAEHPRIDLLRHRSMSVRRSLGFDPVIHTAELADVVRDHWRALRPFVEWVGANAEPRIEG
ncbi:MAG: hypothetical protein JWN22_3735 [Nocardioides sp.]|nr:hypothetical protein [Nocardioides sp.]